jgi:hypothetical protein
MSRKILLLIAFAMLTISALSAKSASADYNYRSTNQNNADRGRHNYSILSNENGEIIIEYSNTRNWWTCLEYRTEATQPLTTPNPNILVDDHWPSNCIRNETVLLSFTGKYVCFRSSKGAESDDFFNWECHKIEQPPVEPELSGSVETILPNATNASFFGQPFLVVVGCSDEVYSTIEEKIDVNYGNASYVVGRGDYPPNCGQYETASGPIEASLRIRAVLNGTVVHESILSSCYNCIPQVFTVSTDAVNFSSDQPMNWAWSID